ncbi:CHAT domain-containing protein [Streptomyces coacervatus]|uniref:CHAT domain-containing protein n=1 Tax=Streptomyces coacervatus TaxID=647381 RepID=A0ABP7HJV8_9ACTN|nr:CHAT domain-containing protein [Streptomyces coacervatus]MDF2272142.1 CHAT domain-containing protein [Streptomyces coacervatus]
MTRESLLAAVIERLKEFHATGNARVVLEPRALAEAAALMDCRTDPVSDWEPLCAAGLLHWQRYLALPEDQGPEELERAVELLSPVYRESPDVVPGQIREFLDEVTTWHNRAVDLLDAADTQDRAAIEKARDLLQRALEYTALIDPLRAMYLSTLCSALVDLHANTGNLDVLAEAVRIGQEAVEAGKATGVDDPTLARYLSHYGQVLHVWHERVDDLKALTQGISALREAVTKSSAEDRPDFVRALGNALQAMHERVEDPERLKEAIELGREALAETASGHPLRWSSLGSLAGGLLLWHKRTGDPAALEEAIGFYREAVEETPPRHKGRGANLSALGIALRVRYDATGDLTTLDDAIDNLREAVAVTRGGPLRPGFLTGLSNALRVRYERIPDEATIEEAIRTSQQAAEEVPPGDSRRAGILTNLGGVLMARHEQTGAPDPLAEAITVLRQASEEAPDDSPNRGIVLSGVGLALRTRYERTGDLSALEEAVQYCRRAVAATPTDPPPPHPDSAKVLANLGGVLNAQQQHARPGDTAARDKAAGALREAAGVTAAPPNVRLCAARDWGRLEAAAGHWAEAAEGLSTAVGLLPRLAARHLQRSDQEHQLTHFPGLASDAAAAALQCGRADRAMEVLEQGRAVLLAQALESRSDLTELHKHDPKLAAQVNQLRQALDDDLYTAPLVTDGLGSAPRGSADRRHALALQWDILIQKIRNRSEPELQRFLLPPSLDDLLPAAQAGAIITVNVSGYRSDALILTPQGAHAVPLPALTPEAVAGHVATFLTAVETAQKKRRDAADRVQSTLGWLWDVLAEPVLTDLGLITPPEHGQPWPRIWWSPTGLLNFLPLHAAGHHDRLTQTAPPTVLDRAISSYTPTVRALQDARRKQALDPGLESEGGRAWSMEQLAQTARQLVVAMPRTPGQADLPGAEQEAQIITHRFPGTEFLLAAAATRDRVLAALRDCSWAHFACHAYSDMASPSNSHLLLHGAPLTIVDVSRLQANDAALAFLSACSTYRGGAALPDEAVHLASAFQLAGYQHVVAAMWPVLDQSSVQVAERIYAELDASDALEPDVGGTASALHAAVRELRASNPGDPLRWAPYVHAGP